MSSDAAEARHRAMKAMQRVEFVFVGAGLWDGGDVFPDGAPVPQVPAVGTLVAFPDEDPRWVVASVTYDYRDGLYWDPVVVVRCEERA